MARVLCICFSVKGSVSMRMMMVRMITATPALPVNVVNMTNALVSGVIRKMLKKSPMNPISRPQPRRRDPR